MQRPPSPTPTAGGAPAKAGDNRGTTRRPPGTRSGDNRGTSAPWRWKTGCRQGIMTGASDGVRPPPGRAGLSPGPRERARAPARRTDPAAGPPAGRRPPRPGPGTAPTSCPGTTRNSASGCCAGTWTRTRTWPAAGRSSSPATATGWRCAWARAATASWTWAAAPACTCTNWPGAATGRGLRLRAGAPALGPRDRRRAEGLDCDLPRGRPDGPAGGPGRPRRPLRRGHLLVRRVPLLPARRWRRPSCPGWPPAWPPAASWCWSTSPGTCFVDGGRHHLVASRPSGPFADEPHLWLQQFTWDARRPHRDPCPLDPGAGSATLRRYVQCHQAWRDGGPGGPAGPLRPGSPRVPRAHHRHRRGIRVPGAGRHPRGRPPARKEPMTRPADTLRPRRRLPVSPCVTRAAWSLPGGRGPVRAAGGAARRCPDNRRSPRAQPVALTPRGQGRPGPVPAGGHLVGLRGHPRRRDRHRHRRDPVPVDDPRLAHWP